jgi:hypothetical protein
MIPRQNSDMRIACQGPNIEPTDWFENLPHAVPDEGTPAHGFNQASWLKEC